MEWPDHVFAMSLFPSLFASDDSHFSDIPTFPKDQPVWNLLNDDDNGLRTQLMNHINETQNIPTSCSFDESNGPVHIDASAHIEPGVHFIGPCYVGPRATIRQGAYIRQYAWICSEAIVGHCTEVKHSILLPGAQAPHFNYVGDSILGTGVNLGAGVKLSNLRNDGTEVYLKIGTSRFPSGLRKFGAILGENCALGCNAVTNPGVVLGRDSIVFPNATVTGIHSPHSKL